MARRGGTDFLTGFLGAYNQASQARKENELNEQTRKLQTKLFEKQLEAMEMQNKANQKLGDMQGNTSDQGPQKPKSILDILADPMGQQLLMQSGQMNAKDIISTQKQSTPFDIKNLPPGMVLSGVKVTPDGQPMYDFSLPERDKYQDKADVERGEKLRDEADKATKMSGLIYQADSLLNDASGGYIETGLNMGKRVINTSDKTTQANEKLKLISGWLVANVPRMEGPQSEFDVKNYQDMAGKVADSTVPIADRRAALKILLELQNKYKGEGGSGVIDFSELPD